MIKNKLTYTISILSIHILYTEQAYWRLMLKTQNDIQRRHKIVGVFQEDCQVDCHCSISRNAMGEMIRQ